MGKRPFRLVSPPLLSRQAHHPTVLSQAMRKFAAWCDARYSIALVFSLVNLGKGDMSVVEVTASGDRPRAFGGLGDGTVWTLSESNPCENGEEASDRPCGRPEALVQPVTAYCSGSNQTAPSGGRVISAEYGWPCHSRASASMWAGAG